MRHMRTAPAFLAMLAVLAGAGVVSAQTKTQTQIGGWNLEGEIESGLRGLPQNPNGSRTPGLADGKFEEYRDINGVTAGTGLFLENLHLRLFRPDEAYSIEVTGKDWGLHTQEFHLMGERLGQWQAGFDWDQMRHIYSTDSQTLFKEFGGNTFIVRGGPGFAVSARPPLQNWNQAPPWGCSDSALGSQKDCDGQISQQWYTGRLFFKLSPTPNTDVSAELTRIFKDGQRPFGMAFSSPGGNFAEFVQPISQTIYEFKLRGGWMTEMFQLQGGYTASVFVNDFPWVRADNPCNPLPSSNPPTPNPCPAIGATGQFGTTSLPPNNQAHTFNLSGGVNLPMRTRVNANFTYQFRFQDQDFQKQTYSNGLVATDPSVQNPQSSLHGNVQTALFNLDATSRPLQAPVTFTLKYRLYDYMDNSDVITWGGFIINDQNAVTPSPYRAGRYSFLRQNADVASRYQFMPGTALTLGVGWEGWNRSHDYEVTQSDEALAKAAFDYTPTDWLLARLSYTAGFRRGNLYNSNAWGEANGNQPPTFQGSGSQKTTMRKFNEGDRDQQVVNLMLQITPTDALTFTPSAGYKNTNYISSGLFDNQAAPQRNLSKLGLQQAVSWNAGMDINWTPTDRVSFSVGYVHESIFHKQRNRNNPPDDSSMDWISDSTDTVETFHGSVKATILPEKLVFKLNGNYSQALGRVETYTPNCTGSTVCGAAANIPNDVAWRWPAFYDSLAHIDAAFEYNLTKAWTTKLFYVYEHFTNHNWQEGASLTPFLGPSVAAVFLGQSWRNYTAQIVGVTLKYKFE
jgi:MtrB/PioB family decaheme-associated outer membrane protein